MPERYRLFVDEIETVGFVDKGDDPEAEIVFFKRAAPVEKDLATFSEIGDRERVRSEIWDATYRIGEVIRSALDDGGEYGSDEILSVVNASLSQFSESVSSKMPEWLAGRPTKTEKRGMFKGMMQALGLKKGATKQDVEKLLFDGVGGGSIVVGDPSQNGDGPMTFDVNKLDPEARAAFDAAVKAAVADQGGDVNKALTDLQAIAKAAQDRADAAEKRIQKMEDDNERDRYIQKVSRLGLPGASADDFADVLRKAESALAPEERAKLDEVLASASAAIKSGALMGEVGVTGRGPSSVSGEVESLAKAYREADPKLSQEEARAKVWIQRPDLYTKHRAETAHARTLED